MSHIINISLYPFTSHTFFVLFPCACTLCVSLFGLISRLIRGDYCGIHS